MVAAVFAVGLQVLAQSPNTASVTVTVTDPNGAVIPGAKISIVNTGTGAVRNATTGADGSATIAALPLTGNYSVKVYL